MEGLIIPIVFFLSTAIVTIYIRKYINDERMAMIDKGVNLGEFKGKDRDRLPNFMTIRFALLLIGFGAGILAGGLFESAGLFSEEEVGYFSSIFIFGGVGLVISYLIEQRKRESLPDWFWLTIRIMMRHKFDDSRKEARPYGPGFFFAFRRKPILNLER